MEKQLVEIIKIQNEIIAELIGASFREMCGNWCGLQLNKLQEIQKIMNDPSIHTDKK